jgi:tetratricopeptide (TPR) repeat protein
MADIFSVQEEIAREISEKLRLQLTGEEKKRLAKPPTRNKEAYQLYLKASYFAAKWSPENQNKAIEYSQQAIEKDPTFANAYAVMAWAYTTLGNYGFLPPREAFTKAKAAALQALALDEGLSQAHAALAFIRLCHEWDWLGGEKECRRALELNPHDAMAYVGYSYALIVMGRHEEAVTVMERAMELEPLSPAVNLHWAGVLFLTRQDDRTVEQLRKTIELDPNILPPRAVLASLYAYKGMYAEATEECEKTGLLPGGKWISRSLLGYVYARAGKRDEALNILRELKPLIEENRLLRFRAALIWAALNESDQAFELLEKLCDEHFFMMIYLQAPMYFDNLKSDPRFGDLMRRMGLAQ